MRSLEYYTQGTNQPQHNIFEIQSNQNSEIFFIWRLLVYRFLYPENHKNLKHGSWIMDHGQVWEFSSQRIFVIFSPQSLSDFRAEIKNLKQNIFRFGYFMYCKFFWQKFSFCVTCALKKVQANAKILNDYITSRGYMWAHLQAFN